MKLIVVICIILTLWCVYFYLLEKLFRWLGRRQKQDAIKKILYENSDYFFVNTLSGKEYMVLNDKFYRI